MLDIGAGIGGSAATCAEVARVLRPGEPSRARGRFRSVRLARNLQGLAPSVSGVGGGKGSSELEPSMFRTVSVGCWEAVADDVEVRDD